MRCVSHEGRDEQTESTKALRHQAHRAWLGSNSARYATVRFVQSVGHARRTYHDTGMRERDAMHHLAASESECFWSYGRAMALLWVGSCGVDTPQRMVAMKTTNRRKDGTVEYSEDPFERHRLTVEDYCKAAKRLQKAGVTVARIAILMGVSESTVRRWLARGRNEGRVKRKEIN